MKTILSRVFDVDSHGLAILMACACCVLGLTMCFVLVARPASAWAETGLVLQNAQIQSESPSGYYAVLHEDGSLVFQAQPSDEEGAINYSGSCAPYPKGKAPWLAKAALIESVSFDESFAEMQPESLAFWFLDCENLQTVDLQNLDSSASTNMRSMFSGCSALRTIDHLSSFDTSSCTYFESMFRDCSSLTSLDVSHFDATHAGIMCFMFAGCTNLETLNMAGEGWRTSSLFLMVHVWENCSSLKSLDLSYLDTSNVRSMARDFNGCSSLEYLDLSGADTSGVGNLTELFNNCDNLTTVKLGPKFTFNGVSDAPQCSLPRGMWQSAATGIVYASADVPNNTADTYTLVSRDGDDGPSGGDPSDPLEDPDDVQDFAPGEYPLPNLKSSLGMFNHFVDGSSKLTVTEDKVTLEFVTNGEITLIRKTTKVAIGPSSKLANVDDMKEGETKYVNSLLGNPAIFEGVLVSSGSEPNMYAFELEFAKEEFEQMIREDGGIYLTLFHGFDKNAWHKGDSDLLLTLGDLEPSGQGGDVTDPAEDDVFWLDQIDDVDAFFVDGAYSISLDVSPSMVKLSGHDGTALEPKLVISGDDAWLITSYRSTLGSAWRYSQMAWGSYEEVLAANENGVSGAPTFKDGKSGADGLSDATIDSMTFALPIAKDDFIAWAVSGEAKMFTVRYVKGYSSDHDGDWWKASDQPTMTVANVHAETEPIDVPADYAAVLDALLAVPKDLGMYTDESVQNLEENLAAVCGTPMPSSQQASVNSMASAIQQAISELKLKADEASEPNENASHEASPSAASAPRNDGPSVDIQPSATKITNVTINAKTVTAKTIKAAIVKAGVRVESIKTVTLGKKVGKIAKGAFKGTRVITIIAKTKKLKKKSVKGSLMGSKVKTVKVKVGKAKQNKAIAKKYRKLFTKKIAGKKAAVVY